MPDISGLGFDIYSLKTPCYVVDEGLLEKNLKILRQVCDTAGCKILLAQKAFSMYSTYPLISQYLDGTTASGLNEARLGKEEFGKETHIFSPAYRDDEFDEIMSLCDHIVFNSFPQWIKYRDRVRASGKDIGCGIRINPGYSEIETAIYDPCRSGSRLGVTIDNFLPHELEGISGLHFHTMCEQNSDTLERTVYAAEKSFGEYFGRMRWLNFGGGHHITRQDYDIGRLVRVITYVKEKYGVEVYLEPGEAVALNAGFLVSEVLDITHNGMDIAIIDASAACHMPDVLEMPYRPKIIGAGESGEKAHTFRLGAATCLAGDVIGDYSFDSPLVPGDRLVFCDMAIYSMCKNNTFNGINLPDIYFNTGSGMKHIKSFGYEDFRARL